MKKMRCWVVSIATEIHRMTPDLPVVYSELDLFDNVVENGVLQSVIRRRMNNRTDSLVKKIPLKKSARYIDSILVAGGVSELI